MTRKININDLPDFDVTDYLDDAGAVLEYLAIVMVDGYPALIEAALADIARISHWKDPQKPPASSV
jgi:DNA-binding phage protein